MNKMMIDRATVQQAIDALENHAGNYKLTDAECDVQDKAITALREAIEEDEKTTAGNMGRAKLAALLEQGFSVNGVSIAREREDGEVERGAVTYGGMVLWWHPEQHSNSVEIDRIETDRVACWKCNDADTAFQEACDVPECGMREAAAKIPESGEIKPGMEPVAYFIGGGLFGNEMQDWEISPVHGPCDKLNESAYNAGKELKIPLYAEQKMELYGWGVTGCIGVYMGEYAQHDAEAAARRCGGTARAFALYREAVVV